MESVTPWNNAPLTTTAPFRERILEADGGGGISHPKTDLLSIIICNKVKLDSQILQVFMSVHVRQFYGQLWHLLFTLSFPYPHPLFGMVQLPFANILPYGHVKHI